jgi:cytidylate kinase
VSLVAKLVISGFTAAGKTTHAKLLAEEFALPYFSATDALSRIVSERTGHSAAAERWTPEIDRARNHDVLIDDLVDEEMVDLLRGQPQGVFDACLLPWIASGENVISVWIDSGLASRVRKCFVSHLEEGLDFDEARRRVLDKDAKTVDRLLSSHHASYWPTRDRFDVIVTNGDLIPDPTRRCADDGIAAFHQTLVHALKYCVGGLPSWPDDPRILHVRPVPA